MQCTDCLRSLPRTSFYNKHTVCKTCSRKKSSDYYNTHKTERAAYARNYYKQNLKRCLQLGKKTRDARYKLVEEAKKHPCMDCGKTFPVYVMDLDHVRGRKQFALGQIGTRSIRSIRAEIKKCDPVCANCHRERTYQRNNG